MSKRGRTIKPATTCASDDCSAVARQDSAFCTTCKQAFGRKAGK